MRLKQAGYLLVLAAVTAVVVNLVSPNAIPWVGKYRQVGSHDTIIIPPDPSPGDPPYIGLDVAELDFQSGRAIFVDAREPEEFRCGTIPGSINIPFDSLPGEGDLTAYFDSALGGAPRDTRIVVFCSGDECDLSLHLARNMQVYGYTNLAIFYGGSREWERWVGKMERRVNCDA